MPTLRSLSVLAALVTALGLAALGLLLVGAGRRVLARIA